MDLTVVIVNWNAAEYLRGCLESLPAATHPLDTQTVVVDNASTDSSVTLVRANFPAVQLIESELNVGFGKGANLGLEIACGKFVAVLNPDLHATPGSLVALVTFLENHPKAGLVGPRIVLPNGTIQSKAGKLPKIRTALPGYVWLGRKIGKEPKLQHDSPQVCDLVHGSCMVFRRESLGAIEGIPTQSFMYGEEVGIGYALERAGYTVWYDPKPQVIHFDDVSANQRWSEDEKFLEKHEGAIRITKAIMSPLEFFVWDALTAASFLIRWLVSPLRPSAPKRPYFGIMKIYLRALLRPAANEH